ncbi:MAG TPA: hypothetical protein VII13_09970 [Vicinamibacteria bacterium]|jgi:hypothetical protein
MIAVALAALLSAPQAPSPDPAAVQTWREYCSLLRGCGLEPPPGACTPDLSSGVEGVRYDEERCAEPRALAGRGVSIAGSLGFRLYRFLGRRYQVHYPLEGTLALSAPRLAYLLGDLPLAARLLTHYRKTPYSAVVLEGNRVRASRGKGLTGDGYLLSGSPAERVLYYFGSGTSSLGPWTLRGQALLHVAFEAEGAGLRYRARIVSTPTNAFMNTVMNMGLFKSVLRGRVREVLDDIAQASASLQRDGGRSLLGQPGWTEAEQGKIAALLRLP